MNKRKIITLAIVVAVLLVSLTIAIIVIRDNTDNSSVSENVVISDTPAESYIPQTDDSITDKPDAHYVESPDAGYFTSMPTIVSGYNITELNGLEINCLGDKFITEDEVSYVLVNAFSLALQAYCNDNNITEKFNATVEDVLTGDSVNIVKLRVHSTSYELILNYDLSTDYVEVVTN